MERMVLAAWVWSCSVQLFGGSIRTINCAYTVIDSILSSCLEYAQKQQQRYEIRSRQNLGQNVVWPIRYGLTSRIACSGTAASMYN